MMYRSPHVRPYLRPIHPDALAGGGWLVSPHGMAEDEEAEVRPWGNRPSRPTPLAAPSRQNWRPSWRSTTRGTHGTRPPKFRKQILNPVINSSWRQTSLQQCCFFMHLTSNIKRFQSHSERRTRCRYQSFWRCNKYSDRQQTKRVAAPSLNHRFVASHCRGRRHPYASFRAVGPSNLNSTDS